MTITRGVSKTRARKVLDQVRARYKAELEGLGDLDQPKLHDHIHEGLRPGSWSINWESGPWEWAIRFCLGGIDEDVYSIARARGKTHDEAVELAREEPAKLPEGVFVEPVSSFTLGIYPDWSR